MVELGLAERNRALMAEQRAQRRYGTPPKRAEEGEPYTIAVWPDAARLLGVGRNAAYEATRSGFLKDITIKVGQRSLVLYRPLIRRLNGEEAVPIRSGNSDRRSDR